MKDHLGEPVSRVPVALVERQAFRLGGESIDMLFPNSAVSQSDGIAVFICNIHSEVSKVVLKVRMRRKVQSFCLTCVVSLVKGKLGNMLFQGCWFVLICLLLHCRCFLVCSRSMLFASVVYLFVCSYLCSPVWCFCTVVCTCCSLRFLSVFDQFNCVFSLFFTQYFYVCFLFTWCFPVDTVPDHRPLPPSSRPGHSGSAGGGLSLSQPALPLHRPPAAGPRPGGGILRQHQGVLGHARLCARQNPQLRGERRQPVGCSVAVCLESTANTVTWLLPSGAV